jgi:ABC-type phosphate transport system substrate-binding protein
MKKVLLSLALGLFAANAMAAPVIIANPAAGEALSDAEAKKLFLGKLKKLPNGTKPVVVEYNDGTDIRSEFHGVVTGKSDSQLQAYWSKLVFTGKANPPKTMGSSAAVLAEVSSNPAAVGYVDESEVTGSVVVIYTP